ncbi:MAG TPA: hypothetical protein G4O00_13710 [Thermoflexia bacterium]|jgi:predicted nucleic acid-binding protein|nr:hypothetical protein [Thermoflexia bacterium]
MPTVILDTDFLSAFLKIERLDLVRDLFRVEVVWIPPAVHREIAQTDLLTRLVDTEWLEVVAPDANLLSDLTQREAFQGLGAGEQECIALALRHPDAMLLTNDNKARQVAAQQGLAVVNIPAFLLACKRAGMADRASLEAIVRDLQDKDHYEFRQEVLKALLE